MIKRKYIFNKFTFFYYSLLYKNILDIKNATLCSDLEI